MGWSGAKALRSLAKPRREGGLVSLAIGGFAPHSAQNRREAMGSISSVWHWLIHVPFLGWIVALALIAYAVIRALVLADAWEQYRNGR